MSSLSILRKWWKLLSQIITLCKCKSQIFRGSQKLIGPYGDSKGKEYNLLPHFNHVTQLHCLRSMLFVDTCFASGILFASGHSACLLVLALSGECPHHQCNVTFCQNYSIICYYCYYRIKIATEVGLWVSGRASNLYKNKWWGTGMFVCLEQGAHHLHIIQLMLLSPHITCFVKFHYIWPLLYWFPQAVI